MTPKNDVGVFMVVLKSVKYQIQILKQNKIDHLLKSSDLVDSFHNLNDILKKLKTSKLYTTFIFIQTHHFITNFNFGITNMD